ncbi:Putative component of 'biosynthetic module' [Clostridium collagenovorans DSM 3089]|uniref:Putative component of 'biosynthetic module n=1 Tax=Clostridium collagenovorans DSM 3089 TaxID=1121306 RepID=A0A1M5VUB6_9CLOT|nr:YceG family protein [Clostridium collagenovorans]SHH78797.1 Putative component of 'biosynthetic module' [Clostridium collagenovorans DSM 3089]
MEKWSLNNLEIAEINAEIENEILSNVKLPVRARKGFKENSSIIYIPRYFYRFIGVMEKEEEYFEHISKIDLELRCYADLYLKITNGFERNIAFNINEQLNKVWNQVNIDNFLDTTLIMDLMESNGILPSFPNRTLNRQIKNNFKGLMDYYYFNNRDVEKDKLKKIIGFIVSWINLYLYDLFKQFEYRDTNPKILFYGAITEEECLFLTLLATLGCDVLYFNSHDGEVFKSVDKVSAFSKEVCYSKKVDIPPFPIAMADRKETTAYNAREDLKKVLHSEESLFYKPWQLSEYELSSITLKTTYEELFIWGTEEAYLRDGWVASKGKVVVPNIFAKIRGTHEDVEKYWEDISKILKQENTKFYNKLPIIDYTHLEYSKFGEVYPKNSAREFDVKKLINSSWWKYGELRLGLQYSIALAIKEMCLSPVIKNINNDEFRDFAVEIFSVLINLENQFMELLQAFDYPQKVPKVVIYNNEQNGNLSFEDCVLLAFLNKLGVDIFIFNPSGYSDVERYTFDNVYDVHNLEKMRFNLAYRKFKKKKSFIQKIFGE